MPGIPGSYRRVNSTPAIAPFAYYPQPPCPSPFFCAVRDAVSCPSSPYYTRLQRICAALLHTLPPLLAAHARISPTILFLRHTCPAHPTRCPGFPHYHHVATLHRLPPARRFLPRTQHAATLPRSTCLRITFPVSVACLLPVLLPRHTAFPACASLLCLPTPLVSHL